jgi:hypothetical protein
MARTFAVGVAIAMALVACGSNQSSRGMARQRSAAMVSTTTATVGSTKAAQVHRTPARADEVEARLGFADGVRSPGHRWCHLTTHQHLIFVSYVLTMRNHKRDIGGVLSLVAAVLLAHGVPSFAATGLLAYGARAEAAEKTVKPSLVPAAVHDAVKVRYPDARAIRYVRDAEHGKVIYEVTIKAESRTIDVSLSPEGRVLAEEEQITRDALPPAVSEKPDELAAGRLGADCGSALRPPLRQWRRVAEHLRAEVEPIGRVILARDRSHEDVVECDAGRRADDAVPEVDMEVEWLRSDQRAEPFAHDEICRVIELARANLVLPRGGCFHFGRDRDVRYPPGFAHETKGDRRFQVAEACRTGAGLRYDRREEDWLDLQLEIAG